MEAMSCRALGWPERKRWSFLCSHMKYLHTFNKYEKTMGVERSSVLEKPKSKWRAVREGHWGE